jgi:hypothetical protein
MSDTGTAELSSLLIRLNAYTADGVPVRTPSPSEAMAIYSVAVRLVQLQMSLDNSEPVNPGDLAASRDVLLGTRRLLRAALDRLERVTPPNLVLIEGGAPQH